LDLDTHFGAEKIKAYNEMYYKLEILPKPLSHPVANQNLRIS